MDNCSILLVGSGLRILPVLNWFQQKIGAILFSTNFGSAQPQEWDFDNDSFANEPSVSDISSYTTLDTASETISSDDIPNPSQPDPIHNNLFVTKLPILVDTEAKMLEMLEVIEECPDQPTIELSGPSLYMDGEGGEIYGKGGYLYLWQVYVEPADMVFIIDILTMGDSAFSTRHPKIGVSFRDILESDRLIKAFCKYYLHLYFSMKRIEWWWVVL